MKNYTLKLFISILVFSPFFNCFGQSGFSSGGRFAMGSSKFTEAPDSDSEVNTRLMFAGGFNANYFFGAGNIGLSTDVMLNFLGAKTEGTVEEQGTFGSNEYDYKDNFRFVRIELPLLVKLAIPVNEDFSFVGFAGPSFDFNLAGNQERTYEDNGGPNDFSESIDDLETISNSFKFGAGIMVTNAVGKIFMLDARWSRDLSSFTTGNTPDVKLGYFAFSIGFGF
ncbi:MAG: outer membrane beta-barrel protein [Luteibaculum sp.]